MPLKEIIRKGQVYHIYYRRSGGYKFLLRNFLRLAVGLGIFAGLLYILGTYVFDLETATEYIFGKLSPAFIVLTLFVSECLLGILPPDLYIIWAGNTFEEPYWMVLVLATVSYAGGVISYYLGTLLYHLKAVKNWVEVRFVDQFATLKKFGGLLIFLAAMTPLPYSPLSLVAGAVHFPLRIYLIVGLSRFLRFFLYALILYQVI